jgi:hypothetical protein
MLVRAVQVVACAVRHCVSARLLAGTRGTGRLVMELPVCIIEPRPVLSPCQHTWLCGLCGVLAV